MSEPKATPGADLAFAPGRLRSAATFSFKKAVTNSILHFNPGKPSRKHESGEVGVSRVLKSGVDVALKYRSPNKEANAVSGSGTNSSRGAANGERDVDVTKNLNRQISWATNTETTSSERSAGSVGNNDRGEGVLRRFSWKDKATSHHGSAPPPDGRMNKNISEYLADDYRALLDIHPWLITEEKVPGAIPRPTELPDRSSTCTTWGEMMSKAR